MTSSREVLHLKAFTQSGGLISREQGRVVRGAAERLLEQGADVECDLTGVRAMSPSFADELFGELGARLGLEGLRRRVTIRNATEDVKVLVNRVLAHRVGKRSERGGVG
jgi:hypothetical protein